MATRKLVGIGIVTLLASMGLVGSAAGQNNWLLTGGVGNNFGGKATIYSKTGIGTSNAVAEARVTRQDAKDGCENQSPPEPNLAACVKENLAAEAGHTYRATADCHAGRITLTDGNAYTFDGLWTSGDGAGRTKWRDASGQIVTPGIASGGLGISMSWEVLCPGPLRITPAGRSATAGGGARAPSRPAGNAPFTANHVIKFLPGTERQRALLKKIAVVRDMADGDFVTANEDLNDDGMREVIVMSRSTAWCGSGGCTTVVLQQRPNGIAVIFSQLVFEPLAVTNEKIGTYHALAAADDNGGIIIGYKRGTPMFGKQLVYPMNGTIEAGRAAPPAQTGAPQAIDSDTKDTKGQKSAKPSANSYRPAVEIKQGADNLKQTLEGMPYTSEGKGAVIYIFEYSDCPFAQLRYKDWKGKLEGVELRHFFYATATNQRSANETAALALSRDINDYYAYMEHRKTAPVGGKTTQSIDAYNSIIGPILNIIIPTLHKNGWPDRNIVSPNYFWEVGGKWYSDGGYEEHGAFESIMNMVKGSSRSR